MTREDTNEIHVIINLNFSYSCLYVHLSALFNIDTSTPPRMTFKYGSLCGNVVDTRDRYNELVLTWSDMRLRRSREDNVLTILSNDGEELTVVNVEDDESRFSRLVVDWEFFKLIEFVFVFFVVSPTEKYFLSRN